MSQIIEKLKLVVYTSMFTLVLFLINSKYYFRIQIYIIKVQKRSTLNKTVRDSKIIFH